MSNIALSIDNFIENIIDDDIAYESAGGRYLRQARNGNGELTFNKEKQFEGIHRKHFITTKRVMNLWFKEFRPKFKMLTNAYKKAKNLREQRFVLWEQRKLILRCREAIVRVPENDFCSFAFFLAVMTVTIGISVKCLLIPGAAAMVFGILSSAVATFYAIIKVMMIGTKYPSESEMYILRDHTNIISKAICINKLETYLKETDACLTYLNTGNTADLNEKALKTLDSVTDKALDKAESTYNKSPIYNETSLRDVMIARS